MIGERLCALLVASMLLTSPGIASGQTGGEGTEGSPCYGNSTCNGGLECDASSETCASRATAKAEGTEAGPCFGNNTCNQGLACDVASNKCVPGAATAPAPPTGEPAPASPSSTSANAIAANTADAIGTVGPFTKISYPIRIIDRPLTLPGSMAQIEVFVLNHFFTSLDTMGEFRERVDLSATTSVLRAAMGINNEFTVQLSTGFLLYSESTPEGESSLEWPKGFLTSATFLIADTDNLDVSANGSMALAFADEVDTLGRISLGAPARFKITRDIAVQFGSGLLKIDPNRELADVDLTAAVAMQASDSFNILVSTFFVSVGVIGDENSTRYVFDGGIGDIPVGIAASLSPSNMFDLLLGLSVGAVGDPTNVFRLAAAVSVRL